MAEKPTPKNPASAPKPQPQPQPQPRLQEPEIRSYSNGGKSYTPSIKSAGPSGSPKK